MLLRGARASFWICLKNHKNVKAVANNPVPMYSITAHTIATSTDNHVKPEDTVMTRGAGQGGGATPPPSLPTDCCCSCCSNCVWITYAEDLRDYYSDGSERAMEAIDKLNDEVLKAFLKLEFKIMKEMDIETKRWEKEKRINKLWQEMEDNGHTS